MFLLLFYSQGMPNISRLHDAPAKPGIEILDKDGNVFGQVGAKNSRLLAYDEIPDVMVKALMATEDRRFFKHFGIDLKGILRAMLINVRAGKMKQGGSSITQQLAKIAFLDQSRTAKRKIQELIISFWLELRFSKKEIMAMYLNRVYLGGGNYGIDAASQSYFGNPATALTLQQAAMLAGIINKPSRYSPHVSYETAIKRMERVLNSMVDADYITELDALTAKETMDETLILPAKRGNFFSDWVATQVPFYIGDISTDLRINTTVDTDMQRLAEETLLTHMKGADENYNANQASLVTIASDGRVLALVGGKDYNSSQFNRATQALRQPGSSFKLFVFLAALEHGITPYDFMVDEPTRIGRWRPKNYSRDYKGEMTIKRAFAESINTISAKLGQIAGTAQVVEMATRLGITTPMHESPSITLGTAEATLLEMTQAYAHLGSLGKQVRAYGIEAIYTRDGDVLYERNADYKPPQLLGDGQVNYMNNMLKAVIKQGTARRANIGRDVGGKTGTTQNYRDAWFIGVTRQLTTGVWVGNDDNSPMKRVSGGGIPTKIFHDYMRGAMKNYRHLSLRSAPDVDMEEQLPWLAHTAPTTSSGRSLENSWQNPGSNAAIFEENNRNGGDFASPHKKRGFFDKLLGRNKPTRRSAPRPDFHLPGRAKQQPPAQPFPQNPHGRDAEYDRFWDNVGN